MDIARLMQARARADGQPLCFIGAGAYDHHIPAAVWQIAARGEFYSAYTPYQAEASQGTLQLLYEFQSMMTALTALDVSNASLYDGASALAEAVLMAVRANRKAKSSRVLVPRALHPAYRRALRGHRRAAGDRAGRGALRPPAAGTTPVAALDALAGDGGLRRRGHQPAQFLRRDRRRGCPDRLGPGPGRAGHRRGQPDRPGPAQAAGRLGRRQGADIACGEAQPLGMPLSSGGPYAGFLCCKKDLVRQMPGRIVGRTLDLDGKPGFTLTLQAREQHIRRGKATSNICTNQGLLVTAATIHLALLGAAGSGAGGRRLSRQYPAARRPAVRDPGGRAPVRPPLLPRAGPAPAGPDRGRAALAGRPRHPGRLRPGPGLPGTGPGAPGLCHRAAHRGGDARLRRQAGADHRRPGPRRSCPVEPKF